MLPECRNVTKQNCVTLWETDDAGKKYFLCLNIFLKKDYLFIILRFQVTNSGQAQTHVSQLPGRSVNWFRRRWPSSCQTSSAVPNRRSGIMNRKQNPISGTWSSSPARHVPQWNVWQGLGPCARWPRGKIVRRFHSMIVSLNPSIFRLKNIYIGRNVFYQMKSILPNLHLEPEVIQIYFSSRYTYNYYIYYQLISK